MKETEAKWSERVREWRASGQTAERFAEGRGFKGSTLRFWASSLRRVGQPEAVTVSPPAVTMARVVRRTTRTSTEASIVVQVGAARVSVQPDFDPTLLRKVIEAIGGAS
jgi:hypothetical protein